MDQVKINYTAVLLSAFVMFVIGWVWYSLLFQAQWMHYTGITMDQTMSGTDMAMAFGGSFIAYAILFYVQSHIHHAFQVKDVKGGIQAAFWSWFGFVLTVMFVTNAYQQKSFALTFIDSAYWLVSMMIGGMLLVLMRKKDAAE